MFKHHKKNTKLSFIIRILYIIIFVFMASGYSILKTKLTIKGVTTIISENDEKEEFKPEFEYVQTGKIDNIFFYDVIIHNNTNKVYKNWEIRIYDSKYIAFSEFYSSDAIKESNYLKINNTNWDNRIEANGEITVSITFEVKSEIEKDMTLEDYAKYFAKEFVKIFVDDIDQNERNGKIIQNNNATLTLKENETEITDFTIEKADYSSNEPNEKVYVVTITNNSDKTYTKVRGNIYLGSNVLSEISPSEITCKHEQDSSFELPIWIQIPPKENASFYIIIIENEKIVPDIVLATVTE